MNNYFIGNSFTGKILFFEKINYVFNFLLNFKNAFFIIDKNVYLLYKKFIYLKDSCIYIVKYQERSKCIKEYSKIIDKLILGGYGKNTNIIAIGGGVTGDLSGFVSSTYYRGVNFINVPTTLLSQVDSSIGGKTAINSRYGKNLIGSFYFPIYVLVCLRFIKTLNNEDYIMGFSEIIKIAIISCDKFFNYLSVRFKEIIDRNYRFLKYVVKKSIFNKISIVSLDSMEKIGIRKNLNLGHTYAHSSEREV
ncbi:3-dehydroquinate synthase [Candidatus Vidania fulgoroideorum]